MQELFIDQTEQLEALIKDFSSSTWLALDTEFIREKTYYPQLCLIQICNGKTAACIDPLVLDDLTPLLELLNNTAITKVFHAARQDLEIIYHRWGRLPYPVFDTQPAASLLGYGDQIGYAGLIKKILHIDLAKEQSRTDWSMRPLNRAQVRYALDDVIYLGQIYEKIHAELENKGRLHWLDDDFAYLCESNTYSADPLDMWKKIKSKHRLRGVKLAVLQQLAAWREQQAVERNQPRGWILKDGLLVELSHRLPTSPNELASIRGLDPALIRRYGDNLLELIKTGSQLPKSRWPNSRHTRAGLRPEQEATIDLLYGTLRLIAANNNMSPTSIANRKDLEALVLGQKDIALLQGWRKTLAGEPLLELLAGKSRLEISNGRPLLSPNP